MSKGNKQKINEGLDRLKKIFNQIVKKPRQQPMPALILQPLRQNNLRGTGPF
jgi:hypothetical protein